jgi:nucleoid-associated protein YgaU
MKRAMTCAVSLVAGLGLGGTVVLAPVPARCATQTVEHTVRAGDNLHLIAGYYYRDPRQWKRIWKLNRASLRGPSRLVPGKTLQVESSPGKGWEVPYEDFRARVRGK